MKEMKGCELCSNQARIYCDSDQARLCWDCDEKVHGANFLVAKHCRSLLCHVCQTPTPWKASGPKLGPTISVCENCFDGCDYNTNPGAEEEETSHHRPQMRRHQRGDQVNIEESCDSESSEEDDNGDYSTFSSDSEDDDDDEDGVEDEEDDGENQVVPWSCCSCTAPSSPQPPLASSSSSEEDHLVRDGGATVSSTFKRMRHTAILDSDDEDGCSSHSNNKAASMECEISSSSTLRPVKIAKTSDLIEQITYPEKRRHGIVSSLIRFQQNMVDSELEASAIIHNISKMSRRDT